MRTWLIVALWLAWFPLAGGAGVAHAAPGSKVLDRGTRAWADAAAAASLVSALLGAAFVPHAVIKLDPWLTFALGVAAVGFGVTLRLWAARTLGRFFTQSITISQGQFVVTSGPYRFVRHLGYSGMLISLIGLALTLGNWASVLMVVLGFFAAHLPRIMVEEHALENNLGEEYRTFERSHKRLIPGVW